MEEADFRLIDSLAVPASLHDVDGRYLHVNPAAELASGRAKADYVGGHYLDPVPQAAQRHVQALFRRAVDDGTPADFETMFVDGTGQLRGVRAQHLPLLEGGKVVGVLILAYDTNVPLETITVKPEPRLTARQREILDLMAAGRSTGEIAATLHLATDTVRNHIRNVLRELQVHTRLEAIAAARRLGLLASPPLQPPQ